MSKSVIAVQDATHHANSQLKETVKPNPTAVDALVSPVKKYPKKMKNTVNMNYTKQGYKPYGKIDSPQMGGFKYSMSDNMNHRILSSHQKMESGGTKLIPIRNTGLGMSSSNLKGVTVDYAEREFDMQQVPLKIFEMHGDVRHPMKVEEMQGTTIYRTDMDIHGTMAMSSKRTPTKALHSREKSHRKSRGKLKQTSESKRDVYYAANPAFSQSLPAQGAPGAKCSPIITTHPYKLGFLY